MRLPDLRKLRKRAEQMVVAGEYDGAVALYRDVLAGDDANGKAWYGLGYAYYKLGRTQQGMLALREASRRGYAPAARVIAHIERKQARVREADYPFPVFDEAPEPAPRAGGSERAASLREQLARREEELDAFLDRLGARAMTVEAYAGWELRREVHGLETAHAAAESALTERRRAWKSAEARLARAEADGCTAEDTAERERAAAGAARTFQEAEAEQERIRGALREARRALARAVVRSEPRPPELAPLVREVEDLQKEAGWLERQLERAGSGARSLTGSDCGSGVGAR